MKLSLTGAALCCGLVFPAFSNTSVQRSAARLVPLQPAGQAAQPAGPQKPPAQGTGDADSEDEQVEQPVVVTAALEATLDAGDVDAAALFTAACLEHGEVKRLVEELDLLIADEEQPAARRDSARWTRGLILRRRGDFNQALVVFEEFAKLAGHVEARLQVAELLDAKGRVEDASAAYEELLPLLTDEGEQTHVRLRLALLQMEKGSEEEKDALAKFALEEGRDPSLRNRAAVVLGLIDRPADAIELFQVDENDSKRFRQEVRMAEWAIRAEDAEKAQDYAWRASRSAKLKRDRYYALTVLVESHRMDESLDALVDKLAATDDLDPHARSVWIDLLRELGRYDEAIELFKNAGAGTFTIDERRELLEMYREKGDEQVMLDVYRELILEEPGEVEWREGLSRALLERGDRAGTEQLWKDFLANPRYAARRLEAAEMLMDLGLDDLAIEASELCIEARRNHFAALIFLFELHKSRGQLDLAEDALERMQKLAAPGAPERFQLADSWEQLGRQDRAVEVLESVREARGVENSGEDLEMRLAWLYSEVGDEELALERWREIWLRLNSISRRRYAEDRMMTVAARLGSLADIAIDIEQKLVAGTASERDSGLLVRLYTKVGDPVSAAEVIDEFMKQSGGSVIDTLQEKGRVYLACNDYYNYEKVVKQLIEFDAQGEGDYLRQLAMSQLERGKPEEAREVLARLKELEVGTESAEFEAGVLALAGLREDAIRAYRKGIAENPARIESYLLMANLMKELGDVDQAVGMFQYLAETAERDDLFTIAIDGLLNVEAPTPVMQWARRITLERLARRHDKMYLYQLLADLAEQVEEREGMLTALENSLSISGERRPSVLRELMDLSKGGGTGFTGRGWSGDEEKHLAYGRRLIGLAEVVPPAVYLDLGEAFLKSGDSANAEKTFRLASDLPDYAAFQRQAAGLFEQAGFRDEALDLYKRVLVAQSNDVGLMVKVGELEEQNGRDDAAGRLYGEALELLFSRQPLTTLKAKAELKQGSFFAWYGSRNIDDFDKHYPRLLKNLLVVLPDAAAAGELIAQQRAWIVADLKAIAEEPRAEQGAEKEGHERRTLGNHPRVRSRANFHRRLAIAYGQPELADALDLELLAAFPEDKGLLEALCATRSAWGLFGSVRHLLNNAARPDKEVARLRFLVGEGLEERSARRLPIDQTTGLFLPMLMQGKTVEAGVLLRRTDFTSIEREDLGKVEPLFSATLYLDDPDLTLQIGREWLRLHVKHRSGSYLVEPVLQKCKSALDSEGYRNLCLSFTDDVLKKPEETSGMLTILPQLQEDFDEPLITEEQVMELLDDYADGGWGFGLGPVIMLLPEEQRSGAMRTVWSKVKPTSQAMFLLTLVGEAKGDLGPSMTAFIEGAFPDSLNEVDNMFSYYIRQIIDARHNQELAIAMIEAILENEPENWPARSGYARKLIALGREEQALEQARKVYAGLVDAEDNDWEKRQARDQVLKEFLPEHIDAFLAELDGLVESRGNSVELVKKRLDLLRRVEDNEAIARVVEAATQEYPEEVSFLDHSRRLLLAKGDREGAMALLERIIEIEPERKESLFRYWSGLQNPVRALQVKLQLMAVAEEEDGADDTAGTELNGMIFPAGVIVMTSSGSFVSGGGSGSGSKAAEDRPTIKKVKEAAQAEDWEVAQSQFRRLWRKFPKGEQQSRNNVIYYMGNFSRGGLIWPEDEEPEEDGSEDEQDKEPAKRGGLDNWSDEEPEEKEPGRSAYDALAEYEFGVNEMRRLLRSKSAAELDSQRDVFKGLLRARILADGEEQALADLTAAVGAGRAGKLETNMLLTLLDEEPDLQSSATASLLDDLARSVRPNDIGPLRSLARVQARQGNAVEAERLYTWLATRTAGGSFSVFNQSPRIQQRELLKDVKESLEGERRLAVIDAVIGFADPGDYPWAREQFERLVLETYMELLEPADALEHSREVLEGATDFSAGMRRNVARQASVLWAQNGYTDEALKCLEYGICSLDESVVEGNASWWSSPERPGYWGAQDWRNLFPKDGSKFTAYRNWLLAANDALRDWRDEDRVNDRQTFQAQVIISLRLVDMDEADVALETLHVLAAEEDRTASDKLWIIDGLRAAGDTQLADSIERELYESNTLHLERLNEVVRRELEANGPIAAIELGATQTDATLNESLINVLIEAAGLTGDEDEVARWTALRDDAEAARERLEEIAEEERRKAEEEEGE